MDKVVIKILCRRNMLIHCHHHHHQRNTFKQFIRPLQQTDIAERNSSQFRQCHDDASSKDSLQDISGKVERGKHEGGQDIGDNKLSTKRKSLESESSVNHKGNIKDNFLEDVTTPTRSSTIAAKSIKSPGSDTSTCSTSNSSSSCVSSSSCDSTSSSSSSSTNNKNNSLNDSSGKRLPSSDEKLIKKEPPVAPDPETCCESGCVNCVWIKYAEEVKDYYPDHEEKLKEILDMIEDYNVKMFVRMELGMKKSSPE